MTSTCVTESGLIDIWSLPTPLDQWVWAIACRRCVGTFSLDGTYELSIDELADILTEGQLPGVLNGPH